MTSEQFSQLVDLINVHFGLVEGFLGFIAGLLVVIYLTEIIFRR